MSQNIGTLISSTLRPNDSNDIIATAFAGEIKGGHHSVATIALRNAIIIQRKEVGMLCTVYNDPGFNGTYQLSALPNTWIPFAGTVNAGTTSTWLNAVKTVITSLPVSPVAGDRYVADKVVTGGLIGHENQIVEYTSSGWVYTTPINGNMMVLQSQTNAIWRYIDVYPTGKWIKHVIGGLSIKNHLIDEVIEVPENYQYFVYGDLIIEDAQLINYGQVVTLNGDLIVLGSGTFSNFGEYISPIVDRKKYAATVTTVANTALLITHNMNTYDIIAALYEDGVPVDIAIVVLNNNQITIKTVTGVTGRLTVMG